MSTSDTPSAAAARPATVAFVGFGPGDPGLLTLRAAELLAAADTVLLDEFTDPDRLTGLVGEHTRIVPAGTGEHGLELPRAARLRRVIREARSAASAPVGAGVSRNGNGGHVDGRPQGRAGLVVRLIDGCPAAFSLLGDELEECRREGLHVEVVPGVPALTAVPTYAGISLTDRTSPAATIWCAEHPPADVTSALADDVTLVLLGTPARMGALLGDLATAGRDPATPVAVIEAGTTTAQQTRVTVLRDAPAQLRRGVREPALVVVGHPVASRSSRGWFETKPLIGWRVLIPRTKDQAEPLLERLGRYGAVGEVVPTISVEPPRSPATVQRAITGLVTGRYEWIGFTSVNAVRAVRERFVELGLDARAFAGLRIAAVGGVTAQALREWGIEPDLVPSGEQSAQGLLADWPPYDPDLDPINRVLLPRADIATETLVAGLQQLGWEVEDVTAYRTVRAAPPPAPVRDAIKRGAFDAVLFTSSSTVRNLIGIAGKPHASTVIACIGPATAKTAAEYGLEVAVVAPEASAEALVDALAEHGRQRAAAAAEAGVAVSRPSARYLRRHKAT